VVSPATLPTTVPATMPNMGPATGPSTGATRGMDKGLPGAAQGMLAMVAPDQQLLVARWIVIGVCALGGFLFSMNYLLAAVLAGFVGEKEGKTLEILLASPLSDRKLFLIKCVSAWLPSAVVGIFFSGMAAMLISTFMRDQLANAPAAMFVIALILSLPVLFLIQGWFVGIGAAISARAETMKGAGQMLGGVFMILFFGLAYGMPLLLALVPSLRPPLMSVLKMWLGLPFAGQYGVVMLVFGIPAVLFVSLGRAEFRRDRMLA
jgi:ABC-type Na+ efflux pump permease subunit